jgi:hypothetical protein
VQQQKQSKTTAGPPPSAKDDNKRATTKARAMATAPANATTRTADAGGLGFWFG